MRLLDRAIQCAERGATLTTRLLAFARRQELKVDVVSLQSMMPEMLDFLRHSVGPNISIQTEVAPEVSPVEVAPLSVYLNAKAAISQLHIRRRSMFDAAQPVPMR